MWKLVRGRVISVFGGKALVGVYWGGTDLGSPSTRKKKEADGSEILFERSPVKLYHEGFVLKIFCFKKLVAKFPPDSFNLGLFQRLDEEDDTDEESSRRERKTE